MTTKIEKSTGLKSKKVKKINRTLIPQVVP